MLMVIGLGSFGSRCRLIVCLKFRCCDRVFSCSCYLVGVGVLCWCVWLI